ncbi:MAG: IPT/TIG domain-containing protein [Acidobacteriota bacterium]
MNRNCQATWLLAILTTWISLADFAEAGTNWARLYGAALNSDLRAVHQTTDGGYVVSGAAISFGAGGKDAWCLKLDASGDIVWQKTFGGVKDEYANAVEMTADGGCLLVATTYSFGAGSADAWCLRLDSSGNIIWQKTYGGTGLDYLCAVVATAGGGYVLAGGTDSFGGGNGDAWYLKLDAAGNVVWQNAYGGSGAEYAGAVCGAAEGGFILAGGVDVLNTDIYDALYLKVDAAGNVVSHRAYGGSDDDSAHSAGATADGGCILAGGTASWGAGMSDAWCLRLDAAGNIVWQNTFGGTSYDWFDGPSVTSGGSCFLAGFSNSLGAGSSDVYCVKLDSGGNVTWQRTYGGTSADYALGAIPAADGGYVLAGRTFGFGVSNTGSWALKISSTGTIDPSCPDLGRDAPGVVKPSSAVATAWVSTTTPTFVVGAPTAVLGVDSTAATTLLCSGASGPTITSIASKTGKPGTKATIKGTGFSTDKKKVRVYIGNRRVKKLSRLKTTSITFTIPKMKKGTYDVYVVVNGQKSNTIQFEIK